MGPDVLDVQHITTGSNLKRKSYITYQHSNTRTLKDSQQTQELKHLMDRCHKLIQEHHQTQ